MPVPAPSFWFPLAMALLLAVSAGAQEEPSRLRIAATDCARLVEHRPAPDMAYRGGIDAHGRPVAPADLQPHSLRLPETVLLLITVDLQRRFGIPANSALFEAEAAVGLVTVDDDGQVAFNGRPLGDPETLALAEACRQAGGGQR